MSLSTTVIFVVVIAVYMIVMIAIGAIFTKKNKSSDDFYLGGRKMGPLVTAMSAEASDMSGWLLMGLPGVALAGAVALNKPTATGFAEAVWTAIGLAVGTYINWLIVAKRLRKYSEKTNSVTIPDFFANRVHDKGILISLVAALIIIVFFVPYTASGFASVGKLFNSLFGVDYHVAMIVGGIVVALYTVLGGFFAASFTDLIQSIIMTLAIITVVGFCISDAGSLGNALETVKSVPSYFSLTGTDGSYSALPIASTMAWGLGYFGMPHVLLRFMAIKDEKKLKTSRRIASIWVTISMGIAIFIGVLGASFIQNHPEFLTDGFDSERIIIYISTVFGNLSPIFAIVAGLIVAGILASIMSTSDSQLLAASSSFSENIVKRVFFKNISDRANMWVARCTVVAIALIGIVFAWDPDSSVFRIVSFAWAGFGASFGPLMLFSLFWKRLNKAGAIAGILSGAAMVFLWKFVIAKLGGLFAIYELLPAFLFSCLMIFVVSLATKAPDDDVVKEFESVR